MWCFILSGQHLPTKKHLIKQIPWKALPCSPANVIEVISSCRFSLSAIWLSRDTEKDSCSATCHSPALDACSLVPRSVHTNKVLQIHSPYAKWHHPSEATGTKLVNDSWRYSITVQNFGCCLPGVFESSSGGLAPLTSPDTVLQEHPFLLCDGQGTAWSPLRDQISLGTGTECHLKPLASSFKD